MGNVSENRATGSAVMLKPRYYGDHENRRACWTCDKVGWGKEKLRALDFCGFTTEPQIATNWSRVERRLGMEERKRRMLSVNRHSL